MPALQTPSPHKVTTLQARGGGCPSIAYRRSGRGVALVIVLACLVIVSVLTVAFLQAVRTDVGASQSYASGAKTRMLADSALNVVIGQIQEATQRPDEAWVSQPGLIRTFDNAGKASMAYKLYSAETMKVDGAFDPIVDGAADTLANWIGDPSKDPNNVWADMNEPVLSGNVPYYPVVDPRTMGERLYAGNAASDVEGFDAPTMDLLVNDGKGKYVPLADLTQSSGRNYKAIPMPVRWLYLLKDGTRAVARSQSGSSTAVDLYPVDAVTGKIKGAKLNDPNNPPVSRISFWTDDETAKININTASEGTFWDTPVANSWPSETGAGDAKVPASYRPDPRVTYELDLAFYQARQHEFQRYPGHPATTSLSPVLWKPLARALAISNPEDPASRNALLDAVYSLTPRIVGADPQIPGNNYTSMGGTQNIYKNVHSSGKIPLDKDRFYPTNDELFYSPSMNGNPQARVPTTLDKNSTQAREIVNATKFFLAAHSRSPEVNLFNKPRVAIWPLTVPSGQPDNESRLSAFDKVIKFCATVGGTPFIFTRSNPLSIQEDLLGSPKNMEIYNFLQQMTSGPIPGFGGTFTGKFTVKERDQILTEIFDYIRCTNLADVTVGAPYTPPSTSGTSLQGVVMPIDGPNDTRGFGRIPTISEVAVGLHKYLLDSSDSSSPHILEAIALPELYSPMAGYSAMAVNAKVTFSLMKNFTVNGQAIFDKDEFTVFRDTMPNKNYQSRFGGNIGPTVLFRKGDTKSIPPNGKIAAGSKAAPVDKVTMGGKFHVKLEEPNDASGIPQVIQEFDVDFPMTTIDTKNLDPATGQPKPVNSEWISGSGGSYTVLMNDDSGVLGGTGVVARSVVPTGSNVQGDLRLVAVSRDPTRYFEKISGYVDSTTRNSQVTSLRGILSTMGGGKFGSLISGVTIDPTSIPDLPPGINGIDGDWDNAPGTLLDGPFINKADEGTTFQKDEAEVPYIGSKWAFETFKQADEVSSPSIFSPNRQVPSPVVFGSLPTGVARSQGGISMPWQTLLFRPTAGPDGSSLGLPRGPSHSGAANPPDHLLLDLFWMPVVEPYPISDRFSTAGKVNLNYQIVPFTGITRKTGLHAVLKGVKITALNPGAKPAGSSAFRYATDYKVGGKNNTTNKRSDGSWAAQDIVVRRDVDVANTLREFDERFKANRPFISASEICEIPLVPADLPSVHVSKFGAVNAEINADTPISQFSEKLRSFWAAHKLTGDNSLERPYAHIYPRVTTKSNTFSVHVRAENLVVSKASAQIGVFDSKRDRATGEFRGTFVIERYLDPNLDRYDPNRAGGLGPYKVRVISSKQISL